MRLSTALVFCALTALPGCGRAKDDRAAPSASATSSSAAPPVASAPLPAATATAEPVADAPPAGAAPPSSFVGAKSDKACRAQTVELASYQTRGDIALAGNGDRIAATWRVRLAGKAEQQIAFASFDKEGRPAARARAVGTTSHDAAPKIFASGNEWAVVWFDDKGLAYARPKVEPLPPPEVAHVGAVGPDVANDVAFAPSLGGGAIAAAPFGADRSQLGLFLFAPAEGPPMKALGVTHHTKAPKAPAVNVSTGAAYLAWDEGGAIVGTRFGMDGKETPACTIAAARGEKRERLALAEGAAAAFAMWIEDTQIKARGLAPTMCPKTPIWPVAEGKWPTMVPFGETALVAWVSPEGKLLAARLGPDGAPLARGLDASEGTTGVKDPPAILVLGDRVAFAWAETMSPAISTKRLSVRIVDASCVP